LPCFFRTLRTVVLDSFIPDLEGVGSAVSVTLVSLEAARKNRRLILGITFGGLSDRETLKNRS
jgi:hypothetical protein